MTFEWELARERREGREEGTIASIKKMLTKLSEEEIIAMGFSREDISLAKSKE